MEPSIRRKQCLVRAPQSTSDLRTPGLETNHSANLLQLFILWPRCERQLITADVHVDKARILEPHLEVRAQNLGRTSSLTERKAHPLKVQLDQVVVRHRVIVRKNAAAVLGELDVASRFSAAVHVGDETAPVIDGLGDIARVDQVKRVLGVSANDPEMAWGKYLGEGPVFLGVILRTVAVSKTPHQVWLSSGSLIQTCNLEAQRPAGSDCEALSKMEKRTPLDIPKIDTNHLRTRGFVGNVYGPQTRTRSDIEYTLRIFPDRRLE